MARGARRDREKFLKFNIKGLKNFRKSANKLFYVLNSLSITKRVKDVQ